MSLGFFFEASSLSHSLSNFSDRLSAESEEEIWYMSDNSRRCLYPFLKIGLVQLSASFECQREEPSLLVSGLGELQVGPLSRNTYGGKKIL